MGQLSQRSEDADGADGASDWTDLERGFFEAAPPEIAVPPAPAVSFDDLSPLEPARVRRKRAARPRRPRQIETARAPGRGARVSVVARQAARAVWALVRPAAARVWGWLLSGVSLAARRLLPSSRVTRERLERSVSALLSRIARDLPERPDGRTIAVALAALVIVSGVSASVLGSRGPRAAPQELAAPPVVRPPEATPPEATLVAPSAPAVEAPVMPEAARPTLVLPQVRLVAKRRPAKHHPAKHHPARPAVTARPSARGR